MRKRLVARTRPRTSVVRLISKSQLLAAKVHGPALGEKVIEWNKMISVHHYATFADIRKSFTSVDRVGERLVFNLGSHRLIVGFNFQTQTLYFKHLLTHDEYMRKDWK